MVVNETLARRYWPGEDPVGRRLAWGNPNNHGPWMRVVGVIGDIKQAGLAAATEPQTWQPWAQVPDRRARQQRRWHLPLHAADGAIASAAGVAGPCDSRPGARRSIRRCRSPASRHSTTWSAPRPRPQRFNAALLGGFAGIALLLAAVGIGGVLAIQSRGGRRRSASASALGANAGRSCGW